MQNIVFNMCKKFCNDRLRSDRSSGNGKFDIHVTTTRRTTTLVALEDPFPGLNRKTIYDSSV